MVDLAYTEDEIKERDKFAPCCEGEENKGPKYPWGLSFSLENGSLEKLNLDAASFKGGQEVTFTAKGVVTSISSNENQDGTKHQCISITITDMEMGKAKSTDAEKAARMYDKTK